MELENQPIIFDFYRIALLCENIGPVVLAGLLSRFLKESDILIQKLSNTEANK